MTSVETVAEALERTDQDVNVIWFRTFEGLNFDKHEKEIEQLVVAYKKVRIVYVYSKNDPQKDLRLQGILLHWRHIIEPYYQTKKDVQRVLRLIGEARITEKELRKAAGRKVQLVILYEAMNLVNHMEDMLALAMVAAKIDVFYISDLPINDPLFKRFIESAKRYLNPHFVSAEFLKEFQAKGGEYIN